VRGVEYTALSIENSEVSSARYEQVTPRYSTFGMCLKIETQSGLPLKALPHSNRLGV